MVHARTAAAFTAVVATAMLAALGGGAFAGTTKSDSTLPDYFGRPIPASNEFAQAVATEHAAG